MLYLFATISIFLVVEVICRKKSGSKSAVIGASERVLTGEAGEVDVVLDHHDVAHGEHVVEAAARVGGDQLLDADELHHPHGHGGLPEGVALVGVEPALHDQHRDVVQETQQKTTNVAFKHTFIISILIFSHLYIIHSSSTYCMHLHIAMCITF